MVARLLLYATVKIIWFYRSIVSPKVVQSCGKILIILLFTAQCTLVQSAVLRSHMSSVCLSVTLVDCDHRLKSWKLIARTINPTPSLFVAKRRSTYSQGNMGKFWGDYRSGVRKKWHMLENKSGNISGTRKDRGKVTMDGL